MGVIERAGVNCRTGCRTDAKSGRLPLLACYNYAFSINKQELHEVSEISKRPSRQ
jgi:hypothetical protein